MMDVVEERAERGGGPWYQTARMTALVGAVFSGIVVVLLIANLIGSAIIGPGRETRLDALKLRVQKEPDNEALLVEIRRLDLQIRHNRLWRWEFGRRAGYLLLAGVAVSLISARLAGMITRKPPKPQPAADMGELQIKAAGHARWAVVGGLVVLAGVVWLLWAGGSVQFPRPQDQGPPYASLEEKREQWHRFRGPGGALTEECQGRRGRVRGRYRPVNCPDVSDRERQYVTISSPSSRM